MTDPTEIARVASNWSFGFASFASVVGSMLATRANCTDTAKILAFASILFLAVALKGMVYGKR